MNGPAPPARETDANPAGPAAGLRESHSRSLIKGVTYRFLGTLTTIVIAWGITGEVNLALKIGFLDVFAKIAVYYLHERAWARVPMGLSEG